MSKGDIHDIELSGLSEAELLELSEFIDPDVSAHNTCTCTCTYCVGVVNMLCNLAEELSTQSRCAVFKVSLVPVVFGGSVQCTSVLRMCIRVFTVFEVGVGNSELSENHG